MEYLKILIEKIILWFFKKYIAISALNILQTKLYTVWCKLCQMNNLKNNFTKLDQEKMKKLVI
jgi:hypothetical protein